MTSTLLDGGSEAFLNLLQASGGKPLYEQTIEEVRAGIKAVSVQLAVAPEHLHEVVDRRISAGGSDIGVRIYTPRPLREHEAMPIVLHFHGAGFVAGDLDTHDAIARYYCKHADAVVVSVDYRLAPEHPFPAAVDDCYASLTWAADHAGELRGDANRIAVAGDSAGGNLAAVVSQIAKARGGPHIALQVLAYPWVDARDSVAFESRTRFGGGEYFLSGRDMEWLRALYLTDVTREAQDPRVSPLANDDLTGLPPALIVTAGCDPLHDEGKAYADRLAAAGVPVEYRCFEGTIHACMSFAAAIPAGEEALAFVASRMKAALHDR